MRKVLAILLSTLFLSGCAAVKFGTGMITESLVHQGGHYIGAKATGVDFDWRDGHRSIPGFQPVAEMHHSKPEPWAYGGSLLAVALTSELIMWKTDVFKDDGGKKFLTDFWMGYLAMSSLDELNYGLRRSGLLGDHGGKGQNDLSRDNFGEYHKWAGGLSAAHGSRLAYKLAKGKRTKVYWNKFKVWILGTSVGVSYVY